MNRIFSLAILAACAVGGLMTGGAVARNFFITGAVEPAPASAPAEAVPGAPTSGTDARGKGGKSSADRLSRMAAMLEECAPGGTAALAKAWKESEGDPALRELLTDFWLKQDPGGFLRMLCAGNPAGGDAFGPQRISDIMDGVAQKDPEGAMKIAATLQPLRYRRALRAQAILSEMQVDTRKGLEWAAAHPNLKLHGGGDFDKVKLTPADFPFLLSLPSSFTTKDLMSIALNDLPPAEAMKQWNQATPTIKRVGQKQLADSWVKKDPDAALAYAGTEATYAERLTILAALGMSKVNANPAEGAAWAAGNLTGTARNRALGLAADKLDKTDPAAAEALRARLPQNYSPQAK